MGPPRLPSHTHSHQCFGTFANGSGQFAAPFGGLKNSHFCSFCRRRRRQQESNLLPIFSSFTRRRNDAQFIGYDISSLPSPPLLSSLLFSSVPPLMLHFYWHFEGVVKIHCSEFMLRPFQRYGLLAAPVPVWQRQRQRRPHTLPSWSTPLSSSSTDGWHSYFLCSMSHSPLITP